MRRRPMTTDFRKWSKLKVFGFSFFTNFFLAPYYRKFIGALKLKGQERVLELGAGTGAASRHLAAALQQGGSLVCTDISVPLQNEARRVLKKYHNVEFKLGDDSAIDVPEHSMDLALVHFVLHDIPAQDRPTALRTLHRALKPQGRLVLREPINPAHGLPVEEIEKLTHQAGFRILEHSVGKVSPLRPPAYTGVLVQDTRNN